MQVVTTTNLANKLLNADGTRGTFDTGSKAVLSPALGPGYLPPGRSYRVLVVPHSRQDGCAIFSLFDIHIRSKADYRCR